jgi:UDP-glucose:(heptosyl)LPS alpha-1,3-glucosyltransferase
MLAGTIPRRAESTYPRGWFDRRRIREAWPMETKGSLRKLKIAIVLDWFLPSKGGESYLVWLADELSRRGHEVHVFAIKAEEDPAASYRVHLIPVLRWPRSLRMLSFLFNSARMIKRNDFDIIHGVGWTLAMNVFNPHGGVEQAYLRQEFRSISNRLYYLWRWVRQYLSLEHHVTLWIQRRQYLSPRVKRIIAISQMIKRNIAENYGPVVEKVTVVFNSVDLDRFHPRNRDLHRAEKRSVLDIPSDAVVLLFVGNNYRLKGLEPLLAAVGQLRRKYPTQPIRLLVAGRGQVARYRRKARRLGVANLVLFLGSVKNIEQYYSASDIYVHPTFYDSCSLTVLEALASGLPVVTTRFNGAADAIVSEEGGRVIEDPANVNDLAESIAHYFDEGSRTKARTITRQWMEQVPPGYNMKQTLRVYDEVVRETEQERAASAGTR